MRELGILDLMLPAFCECLVLVGIHSYLGLHVIRRKVIFVDLALAQVAALGTTVGFLFGMAPDSVAAFLFSMLFTFFAAAVFAVVRLRNDRVPQEAIIGLVYAVAAAVIILVIDSAPHGAEHIKEVMTGALLWVQWESIVFAAAVYTAIGVFHWVFRDKFLLISEDPERAYSQGLNVHLWDFLFYVTFGIVIAISVRTAGVLLVFVFLIVPAITATLATQNLRWQLIIGWTMGVVVTVVGLGLSYFADTPSGPTVVGFYGAMLVVAALYLYLSRHRSRAALLRVATGVVVTGVAVAMVYFGGRALGRTSLAASRSHVHAEGPYQHHGHDHSTHHGQGLSHHRVPKEKENEAVELPAATRLLDSLQGVDEASQWKVLQSYGAEDRQTLLDGFVGAKDDATKLNIALHMAAVFGSIEGGKMLLRLMQETHFPYVRSESLSELEKLAGRSFSVNPEVADNKKGYRQVEDWLSTAPAQ